MSMRIKAWEELTAAGDNHGDKEHAPTVKAFLSFVDQYKPKHRIHLGDGFDFRPIRKKADEHERRESMQKDFATGKEFLRNYRPTVKLRGNHTERLWDLAEDADGLIGDYARAAVEEVEKFLRKLHCQVFPYDKRKGIYRLGDTSWMHGYASGETAAKKHAQAYGRSVFAHVHHTSYHRSPSLDSVVSRSIACLCIRDAKYNRAHLAALRHENGWLYGAVNKYTGETLLYDAVERDGKFLCATQLVEL